MKLTHRIPNERPSDRAREGHTKRASRRFAQREKRDPETPMDVNIVNFEAAPLARPCAHVSLPTLATFSFAGSKA